MRIGPCELDLHQRQISRDGRPLALSPRAWDVLLELVDNPGRLVTTQQLLARHWQGRTSDETYVRKTISEIRRVLGDDARTPLYLRTVPKQGYVLTLDDTADAVSTPEETARIIAVLPFANFSDDRTLDYFCDGLTEEVLNKLSHEAKTPIVARTSSFQFKDRGLDIREAGRMLGASEILEGSVRTDAGGLIRVTAQFIDAVTGLHRWSEHYDCPRGNDIATQDSIAQAIADRVWSPPGTAKAILPTVILSEQFTSPESFKRLRDAIEAAKKQSPR